MVYKAEVSKAVGSIDTKVSEAKAVVRKAVHSNKTGVSEEEVCEAVVNDVRIAETQLS